MQHEKMSTYIHIDAYTYIDLYTHISITASYVNAINRSSALLLSVLIMPCKQRAAFTGSINAEAKEQLMLHYV